MSDFLPELSTPFPKIAVILGADTRVGQHILRSLLESDQIDKVHALTSTKNIPVLRKLSSTYKRKAREHLVDFTNLAPTFKRISECDIAFCVSYTEKYAYRDIGDKAFSMFNYDAPVQFVNQIFQLGAMHLSIMSHINAEASSRSDFYRLRGDVEDFTLKLRREAAQYSPYLSIFRIPTPVTDASATRSTRDNLRPRSSSDPTSTPVTNEEISRAMIIDSFTKALKKGPPSNEPLTAQENLLAEQFLYSDDVLEMLRGDRLSLGSRV